MNKFLVSTRQTVLAFIRNIAVSFAILLSAELAICALPPDVEQLIQTDKFKEAIERVEALLREKPGDIELEQTRKDLQALLQPGTPGPKASAPVPPVTPPKPQALPPVVAKQLELILADVNKASGEARKGPLIELFDATGPLVRTHPDLASLWAMRALAAVELARADAAKEAGANLLRLGADRSGNEQTLTLLAMLSRKGWLAASQPAALTERVRALSDLTDSDSLVISGAGTDFLSSPTGQIPAGSFELDPPDRGYFDLSELFFKGPYVGYNTYSQAGILRKVQEKLKEVGHYKSTADGVPGPGTQAAILAYQQAQSLLASGRLDSATVEALGLTGIPQTSTPTDATGGTSVRPSASRAEMQQELARLESEQRNLFDLAMTMDRTNSEGKARGMNMSTREAMADRIFSRGEALEPKIRALKKALGVNSSAASQAGKKKPSGGSMNDFRNRAARFDDL